MRLQAESRETELREQEIFESLRNVLEKMQKSLKLKLERL